MVKKLIIRQFRAKPFWLVLRFKFLMQTAMNNLSKRVNQLEESATIAMARLSRELKEQGHDIISLSLGEPDFITPEDIRNAGKQAIDEGFTHYPPISGYPDLRKAISEKFKRENNLNYKPEQIVVSTGAKQSIANVVFSLVDPGDEVIIPAPYWVSYGQIVQLAEGHPVILPTTIETDFKPTVAQIKAAITPKTKLFIFSSPCNPTGTMFTRDELKELAQLFKDYPGIWICHDRLEDRLHRSTVRSSQSLRQDARPIHLSSQLHRPESSRKSRFHRLADLRLHARIISATPRFSFRTHERHSRLEIQQTCRRILCISGCHLFLRKISRRHHYKKRHRPLHVPSSRRKSKLCNGGSIRRQQLHTIILCDIG
jgi:hypothetical protein